MQKEKHLDSTENQYARQMQEEVKLKTVGGQSKMCR